MLVGLYELFVELQARGNVLRNERGASAVEYALLVALIAVVIIGAVTALGTNLVAVFNSIVNALPG